MRALQLHGSGDGLCHQGRRHHPLLEHGMPSAVAEVEGDEEGEQLTAHLFRLTHSGERLSQRR